MQDPLPQAHLTIPTFPSFVQETDDQALGMVTHTWWETPAYCVFQPQPRSGLSFVTLHPDLQDAPVTNRDLTLFVDGSCRTSGKGHVRAADAVTAQEREPCASQTHPPGRTPGPCAVTRRTNRY